MDTNSDPTADSSTINIDFWFDPVCPWCWTTTRWLVDVVAPERNLRIRLQPMSLLFKDEPEEGAPFYEVIVHGEKLLRVMEAVRLEDGDEAAFRFYWEAGRHIHHDQNYLVSAEDVLAGAGLDLAHAAAYDDERFDTLIKDKMALGLDLVGADVGTPILAFETPTGKVGIYGPVLSRIPTGDEGPRLWDSVVNLATTNGFWELKRTRTVGPDFGTRPDPLPA